MRDAQSRRGPGSKSPNTAFARRELRRGPMGAALSPHRSGQMLPWLLALYAGASLLHFTHNAEYLAQYPNLPASWTRADVYFAWGCVATIGLVGYGLYLARFTRIALTVLAIYAGFGFDGLLHYTRAPMADHTAAMNLSIWAEVVAAAVLLINLASVATGHSRRNAA